METSKTDKKTLAIGIRTLIFALMTLFMGPILLSIALSSKDQPLYIPLLILGCLISAFAVFLLFKGIKIIINSMFKN